MWICISLSIRMCVTFMHSILESCTSYIAHKLGPSYEFPAVEYDCFRPLHGAYIFSILAMNPGIPAVGEHTWGRAKTRWQTLEASPDGQGLWTREVGQPKIAQIGEPPTHTHTTAQPNDKPAWMLSKPLLVTCRSGLLNGKKRNA